VRVWSSGICFAFSAFVVVTIGQEFVRGARVRQGATGTDILTAMIGLVARSKRRYGGYIVHLGIVLIFLGFAGQGFKQEEQVVLKPAQQVTVGHFTVRHDGLAVTSDNQKQMITGHVSVFEDGKSLGVLEPARWFFNKHEDQPTTEVAIRRSGAEDVYVVLAGYDVASQSATYAITVNPLVNWIWIGFGVMAIGTGIALLPDIAFSFAISRIPSTATTSLLLLLLVFPAGLRAQHAENPQEVLTVPKSALERDLQKEIICMCGTCGRKRIGECTCARAARMREEVSRLVADGKSREDVYQYYIAKYGSQEPLASPINKGFNRLAWLFPYVLGTSGAVAVAFAAIRWSHRHVESPSTPVSVGINPELQARLDDELRDLD
jgi:cytochrome c-type biogenesis protein CcmF